MSIENGTEREYTAKVVVRHGWAPKPGDTILHAPSGRRGTVVCITITEDTATADVRLVDEGASAPTSVWFLEECLWGNADLDSVVPAKREGSFTQARLNERIAKAERGSHIVFTDDEVSQMRRFCVVVMHGSESVGVLGGSWVASQWRYDNASNVVSVTLEAYYKVTKCGAEPPTRGKAMEWCAKLRCRLCGARGQIKVATEPSDSPFAAGEPCAGSYSYPPRHRCSLGARGEWEILGYEKEEWSGARVGVRILVDEGGSNAG